MATLMKSATGLLLSDSMTVVNPYWDVSPTTDDRVDISSGKVVLKHGNERISMLMSAPLKDYVFQAELSHKPTTLGDQGGVIIVADNNNAIECQSYYNGLSEVGKHYNAIKVQKEGDRYTFYATKDYNIWEVIGASLLLDAHLIGFFLEGPDLDTSVDLKIKSASFYKSNYVTFVGISNSHTIKIYDDAMKEIISVEAVAASIGGGKIMINVLDKMLPLKNATIRLFDNNTMVHEKSGLTFSGGDVYDYRYDLKFLLNDIPIESTSEHDLGYVGVGGVQNKITIINKDHTILPQKTLKVVQYSEYFRGGHFAELALIDSDNNVGEYTRNLILPEIVPNQRTEIMMRTNRDQSSEAPFYVKQYKYKILIE